MSFTRTTYLVLTLLCTLALCGCRHPDRLAPSTNGYRSPITPADITYAQLAERYNQTVASFDTLWTRTDIDIAWVEIEEDGKRDYRSQSGDGKFIMRRPGDTALLVEKVGKVYLWAGSNTEQYWLFDLVDSDLKTAYVGSFGKITQPGRRAYPMPVRPEMVPYLLGLMPLPPAGAFGQDPTIDLYNGQYLVELRDAGIRMLIDPMTFRPSRVDLTNTAGFSMLTATLSGQFPVEVEGLSKTQWPTICEKAEVYVAGYESRLTVSMDYATTSADKVRDLMFDFKKLSKSLKPDQTIDLDE